MHRRLIALSALALAQAAQAQLPAPQGLPEAQGAASMRPLAGGAPAPVDAPRSPSLGSGKIYKSVDAQGRVTYSSMPQPGAKSVDPKPLASGISPYRGAPSAQAGASAQAQPARARIPEAAQAAAAEAAASQGAQPGAQPKQDRWAAISQAQADVKAALAAQAQGVAPLAGERMATGNGGTRFAPAYDQRQAQLAGAVAQAQKQLDDAQKLP